MTAHDDKAARLEHANALIRVIASHGRRFFHFGGGNVYDPVTKETRFVTADRTSCFELRRGRVYFIDAYSQRAIYTHRTAITSRWKGFSNGGTLRSLVEDMRDYIVHGRPIARWKIVIQQLNAKGLEDNVWGYPVEAAQAVRDAAYALPIIEL